MTIGRDTEGDSESFSIGTSVPASLEYQMVPAGKKNLNF